MASQLDASVAPNFKAALGEQLVAAHGRMKRRRRRRQVVMSFATVIVIALLATASLSVFSSEPAAADAVRVEVQPDGSTLVTIQRAGALPSDLQTALRNADIDNNTSGVITGPSRVGALITVAFDGTSATSSSNPDGRSLIVPPGFSGVVDVTIGQAASPGQAYGQPTSPFDPGEPLEGFTKQNDVAAVTAAAKAKGLNVAVIGIEGTPAGSAPPGASLLAASMTASDVLVLRVGI